MVIKVKHLQQEEIHVFSSIDFFLYLVGLCDAGRKPELHIVSLKNKNKSNYPPSELDYPDFCDYEVIIVERN